MKFILLAAAAVIATPVLAQDQTTPPADPAMQTAPATPAADPNATPTTDATQAAPTADPNAAPMATAPAQGTDPAMSQTTAAPAGDPNAADPAGGYQPTNPAVSGTATPGQPVQFQQAPSPSQAFPPPAPLDSYPTCKKGQYDNCKQAGGGSSSRHRASRRRR